MADVELFSTADSSEHADTASSDLRITSDAEESQQPRIPLHCDAEAELAFLKRVNVPPSGDVDLTELEQQIVDAPDFQRLRGIKQLGTAHLVYPGAVHTRFDHSLGALHMAQHMVNCVDRNSRRGSQGSAKPQAVPADDVILIRLFALLHDITHVPFGHALEDQFRLHASHDKDEERIERFIGHDSPIGRMVRPRIGQVLYEQLLGLFRASREDVQMLEDKAYIYDLVNNTVCADLLDYLRRDSHYCGLDLSIKYRFLDFLHVASHNECSRLVIRLCKPYKGDYEPRRDTISELLRLLYHRYLLAERVYYHPAKLKLDALVAGAVARAILSDELKYSQLWEEPADAKTASCIGDAELIEYLRRCKDPSVRALINDYRHRRMCVEVHRAINSDYSSTYQWDALAVLNDYYYEDWQNRVGEENRIASLAYARNGDFLIECPSSDMSFKLARMLVEWKGGIHELRRLTGEQEEGKPAVQPDEVVSQQLKAIQKSHERLWHLRAYTRRDAVKPEEQQKLNDSVRLACKALFTFSQERKANERVFYQDTASRIAREDKLLRSSHAPSDAAALEEAVGRLVGETHANRDLESVRLVVHESFGNQPDD